VIVETELTRTYRSMRVPFPDQGHAKTAKRALEVDREQNAEFVERSIEVEGDELVMYVYSPSSHEQLLISPSCENTELTPQKLHSNHRPSPPIIDQLLPLLPRPRSPHHGRICSGPLCAPNIRRRAGKNTPGE
jgi:hypothetical protein